MRLIFVLCKKKLRPVVLTFLVTTLLFPWVTQAFGVLYLLAPSRFFQWNENGMDGLVKEVIPLLQYLIPGFLAAWIFYSLTAFKRPDTFGQIVQALIFTFLIQSLVVGLGALLLVIGEGFFSVGVWDRKSEALLSAVIAVLLGFLSCYIASSDKLHRALRRVNITRQTSFPSQWYSAFSTRPRFVVLHLLDNRRLYGWPIEWPAEPTRGQFVIEDPSWLDGEGQEFQIGAEAIVIDVSNVQWVEFSQQNGEQHDEQGSSGNASLLQTNG